MSNQRWNSGYSTSKQSELGPLFVCHSAADKAFVEKLCKDLKEATGRAIFFSGEFGREAFKANTSLKIVETCSLGILVLSHEFFTASKWPMMQFVAMLSSCPTRSILPVYFKINISQFKNYKSIQPIWFERWEQWAKEDSHINVEAWKFAVAQIEDYTGVHALYQQSKQLDDHNVREQIVVNVLKNGFSFPGFIPRSTTFSLPNALVPEVARVNPGYYQQTFQQPWPQQQYNFQPPQQQPQAYMQQQPQTPTHVPAIQAPQVPQLNDDSSKPNSLQGFNYYYDGSCGGIRWKKQEDLTPYYKGESSQGAMKRSATGSTKDDSDDDEGNVNKYLVESHDDKDNHRGDVSKIKEEDEEVMEEDNSNYGSDKDGDDDEDEDGDGDEDEDEDGNGDDDADEDEDEDEDEDGDDDEDEDGHGDDDEDGDGDGDDDEDGNGDGDDTDSNSDADYSG